MTSVPLDPQGEAGRALAAAMEDFGPRALSNPVVLANLFKDLLPDSPRETTVLVAVAEAGLAQAITDRVNQGLPADAATHQAASIVAEARAMDPAAVQWAAHLFATAMGYQVSAPGAPDEAGDQGWPGSSPVGAAPVGDAKLANPPLANPPLGTAPLANPPFGTAPLGAAPFGAGLTAPAPTAPGAPSGWGTPVPPATPNPQNTAPASPFGAAGFAGPPAASPWLPGPAGPGRPGSGNGWSPQQPTGQGRSKGPFYVVGAAVIAIVAIIVVVIAVSGGGSGSHPPATTVAASTSISTSTSGGIGTSTTGSVPSSTSLAPPTSQPSSDLTAAQSRLAALLPIDLDTSTCVTEPDPPTGLANLSAALGCGAPSGLPGGSVFAYQFTDATAFRTGVATYNTDKAFDASTADKTCPPTTSDGDGATTWQNPSDTLSGSLECLTLEANNSTVTMPAYIWTITQDNTIVEAIGSSATTFAKLHAWFLDENSPR